MEKVFKIGKQINGHPLTPEWKNVYSNPPRYFYDATNKVLGLDGKWIGKNEELEKFLFFHIKKAVHPVDTIYLGDDFVTDEFGPVAPYFALIEVLVSPNNRNLSFIKGIPAYKDGNKVD